MDQLAALAQQLTAVVQTLQAQHASQQQAAEAAEAAAAAAAQLRDEKHALEIELGQRTAEVFDLRSQLQRWEQETVHERVNEAVLDRERALKEAEARAHAQEDRIAQLEAMVAAARLRPHEHAQQELWSQLDDTYRTACRLSDERDFFSAMGQRLAQQTAPACLLRQAEQLDAAAAPEEVRAWLAAAQQLDGFRELAACSQPLLTATRALEAQQQQQQQPQPPEQLAAHLRTVRCALLLLQAHALAWLAERRDCAAYASTQQLASHVLHKACLAGVPLAEAPELRLVQSLAHPDRITRMQQANKCTEREAAVAAEIGKVGTKALCDALAHLAIATEQVVGCPPPVPPSWPQPPSPPSEEQEDGERGGGVGGGNRPLPPGFGETREEEDGATTSEQDQAGRGDRSPPSRRRGSRSPAATARKRHRSSRSRSRSRSPPGKRAHRANRRSLGPKVQRALEAVLDVFKLTRLEEERLRDALAAFETEGKQQVMLEAFEQGLPWGFWTPDQLISDLVTRSRFRDLPHRVQERVRAVRRVPALDPGNFDMLAVAAMQLLSAQQQLEELDRLEHEASRTSIQRPRVWLLSKWRDAVKSARSRSKR